MNCPELLDRNAAGIYRQTLDGRIIECNEACARILGFASKEDLLRQGTFPFLNDSDRLMIAAALPDLRQLTNLEICLKKKDGSLAWVIENVSLIETEGGEKVIEGLILDITEQRQATERMEFQTQHDALTSLPNRALFTDRLNVALARAKRKRRSLAVLFLDLDHFELLNATFGRGIADRLLKGLAVRLDDTLRTEDSAARYGSDEFICLLSEFGEEENSALIAQRMLEAISRPFNIDQHQIYVNGSVGIALYPTDGPDAETLIKNAAAAMYRAKELGRNTYQLYQPALNARAFERAFLIASLRGALERGEFVLHYQPIINTQTGRIRSLEALLRWNHPALGLVEPASFLVAAEDARLTVPIGEWVLHEASKQARLWDDQGMGVPGVAVNLSPRQLDHPSLLHTIETALQTARLDPAKLELEISEPAMHDTDRMLITLGGLKDLGVRLSLDNFGTGRSSFADLKRMPVDTVKIDQSYVQNITQRSDDAAFVEAMITMARGLDLRVVAEGVETKDQMTFLRNHRCSEMQGFFFGKPLPSKSVEELLKMQH